MNLAIPSAQITNVVTNIKASVFVAMGSTLIALGSMEIAFNVGANVNRIGSTSFFESLSGDSTDPNESSSFLATGYWCGPLVSSQFPINSWWRHQMETFSALLAFCAQNSPVPGEFSTQRPVTQSFDVFFDLQLNKELSKQSRGWLFETPSSSLWRHGNVRLWE